MEIKLDREKRVILLKALNQGSIESRVLEDWIDHETDNMTLEEITAEIDRLEGMDYPENCRRRQKIGHCLMMNQRGT